MTQDDKTNKPKSTGKGKRAGSLPDGTQALPPRVAIVDVTSNLDASSAQVDDNVPVNEGGDLDGFVHRDFHAAREPSRIVADLAITSVTIDIWSYSVRPVSVLESPINIDMLTHRLANGKVRTEVAKFIADSARVASVLQTLLLPNARVYLGTPQFTRFSIYDVVTKTGVQVDSALVITDLLVYAMQNLGIIGMNTDRNHFQLETKDTIIPELDTVLHEIIRADLERHLDIIKLAVAPEGKRYEYSSIIIDRITDKFRLIGAQLRRVGELMTQLMDILEILRVRVDPEAYAVSSFERDLLDHPAIVDLASDATMVLLAASIGSHKLVNSELSLLMKIDQIVARLRDVSRFRRISRDEFKQKFSKRTVTNDKGRPLAVIIGQNFRGGNSVQVLDTIIYDAKSTRHQIRTEAMIESSLSMAQGDVMNHMSSAKTVALINSELHRIIGDDSNTYTPHGLYSVMVQGDALLHVLAMCVVDRVSIGYTDSGKFTLLYKGNLNGIDYVPVSSATMVDEARFADPSEAIMLAEDWDGDFFEGDRVQVLPKEVINNYVYGNIGGLRMIDLDRDIWIRITSGIETYATKTQFLDLLGRGYLEGNAVVVPFINSAVAGARLSAMLYLTNVANKFKPKSPAVYAAMMTRMCREVSAIHNAFNDAAIAQIEARIIDSLVASSTAKANITKSRLQKAMLKAQIRHFAIVIMAQRLGLMPMRGDELDNFNAIQSSQFFYVEEGIAS